MKKDMLKQIKIMEQAIKSLKENVRKVELSDIFLAERVKYMHINDNMALVDISRLLGINYRRVTRLYYSAYYHDLFNEEHVKIKEYQEYSKLTNQFEPRATILTSESVICIIKTFHNETRHLSILKKRIAINAFLESFGLRTRKKEVVKNV